MLQADTALTVTTLIVITLTNEKALAVVFSQAKQEYVTIEDIWVSCSYRMVLYCRLHWVC